MKWLSAGESPLMETVATIGFFDGVHRGHRFLAQNVVDEARSKGLASLLITFGNSPRSVLQPSVQPQLLTTANEKKDRLSYLGADYGAMLTFTPQLSELSAFDFMRTVLKEQLRVRVLLIGWDHRFGHNRSEGFNDYVEYGKRLGIQVVQAQVWQLNGKNVSSSLVRQLVSAGRITEANDCLGYPYRLDGTVVSGYQVGRSIGFPTANLQVDTTKLLPPDGVYITSVHLPNATFQGMMNIGCRPTLNNGHNKTIEVHLIGFSGNLYAQSLKIEVLERLRGEHTFPTLEALRAQLEVDAHAVSEYFVQHPSH